jgi:hypothetical protein
VQKTKKPINKYIYWIPRIVSIIFILFLALFSLDVFGEGLGFWETALALLIHNIPSIALLIVLIFAWKYEIVGGIAFTLFGIFYITQVKSAPDWKMMITWSLIIAGPAFLVGALFFMNWHAKRK